MKRISHDRWIILLTGLLAWASFALGEQVPLRDGLGWEGETYARWVQDFPHELFDVGIDAYCIQRVLPAAVLHYTFRACGISANSKNVVRGYAALNVLSLMLVAAFWCATARRLKMSDRGKWLGFVGLFLNFAVLKYSGYLPVMTDAPAFATGSAMIYCYLSHNRWGLWGATAIGALIWPTQLYIGTILSLFPRGDEAREREENCTSPTRKREELGRPDRPSRLRFGLVSSLHRWASRLGSGTECGVPYRLHWLAAGFVSWCLFLWSLQACQRIQIPMFGGLFPNRAWLPLSLLVSTAYLFFGLCTLLNDARLYCLPRITRRWMVTAAVSILLAFALKAGLQALAARQGYVGLPVYLFTIGITAVAKPGLFLVAHLVFYGPFWLLAIFAWRPICRAMQAEGGVGVLLAVAIGLCHSLDAESRHLIYLVPILLPFVVRVIDRWTWTRAQLATLIVASLAASKFWLVIGGPFADNANAFPDQLFWMNVGLFMAEMPYRIQALACVACAVAFYFLFVRGQSAQPPKTYRAFFLTSSPVPPRSLERPFQIPASPSARTAPQSLHCDQSETL